MQLESSLVQENEILKADDINIGFKAQIGNIAKSLQAVFDAEQDFIVANPDFIEPNSETQGDWTIKVNPLFGICKTTGDMFLETDVTLAPVVAPVDGNDRVDIVEVRGKFTPRDAQKRAFIDFYTKTTSIKSVDTRNQLALECHVISRQEGGLTAPNHTEGWVKIAEIFVPGNATRIADCTINTIVASKKDEENKDWTIEKTATYNIGHISSVTSRFRTAHDDDGDHAENCINSKHIDFGIEDKQINSVLLPTGLTYKIGDKTISVTESVATVLEQIIESLNGNTTGKNDKITLEDSDDELSDSNEIVEISAAENPTSGKVHTLAKLWVWINKKLSAVATSGAYGDLTGTPYIPEKFSDLTDDIGFALSSDVPTKYSDLTDDLGLALATSIPTKVSQLENDSGFITSVGGDFIPKTSASRPGVTALYRRDDDSDFNVQTHWDGTYWNLYGYNGNTAHAPCKVGYATTAGSVKDYGDTSRNIAIGYAGAGLTTETLSHVAGYTDSGTKIKDVSKDVLFSWLGVSTKYENGKLYVLNNGVWEEYKSMTLVKTYRITDWPRDDNYQYTSSGVPSNYNYMKISGTFEGNPINYDCFMVGFNMKVSTSGYPYYQWELSIDNVKFKGRESMSPPSLDLTIDVYI